VESTFSSRIAETLGIELERVSVKFKTAGKVGPVGEGRSAESQAIVTLQKLASRSGRNGVVSVN